MSRTNKSKLVAWDADFYNSLSDDVCFVCLSEKQRYIIREALQQVAWSTRWQGDISGLEIDKIAGETQYRIDDMQTCSDIQTILQNVIEIRRDVDILNQRNFQSTTTIIYNETTIPDVMSPTELSTDITILDTCDNDETYGAVSALVEFINQNNVDFLEWFTQTSNSFTQADNLISAIPVIGLLPADEVAAYAAFLIEEMLDEYNSIVDEDLLQTVKCELFCIANSRNPCGIDFSDLISYFADKLPTTINAFVMTWFELVQFGINGTFAGNQYFYYMCFFQLFAAYYNTEWFGAIGYKRYGMRAASGRLNPSADWSIYCTETCPDYYRIIEQDFTINQGEWTIEVGDLQSNGVAGLDVGDNQRVVLALQKDVDLNIEAVQYTLIREGSTGHGMLDSDFVRIYDENLSEAYIYQGFDGFQGDGVDIVKCQVSAPVTGKAIRIYATVTDDVSSLIVVSKVEIWVNADTPIGRLTSIAPPC